MQYARKPMRCDMDDFESGAAVKDDGPKPYEFAVLPPARKRNVANEQTVYAFAQLEGAAKDPRGYLVMDESVAGMIQSFFHGVAQFRRV